MSRTPACSVGLALAALVGVYLPRPCAGAEPARDSVDTPAARLARAKSLFRSGVTMLGAGDVERALELFLESRASLASGKNSANAAICLERLGRYDEALELYEDVLTRFATDLDEQDRQNLVPTMDALRRRLGELEISANVSGLLLVDGRPRGSLPRETPLLVLPGRHTVRLVKEAYETAERDVAVEERATTKLDLILIPVRRTAGLRVEAERGSAVFVDGSRLGSADWEGTLAPGSHVYQAIHGDRGSRPTSIVLVEGQTTLARPRLSSLGREVELYAEPKTANLMLDGVPIGVAHWRGRLPLGRYMFQASALGFLSGHEAFEISARDERARYTIHLIPWHWPQPLFTGDLELTAAASYFAGASQRADAVCSERCATEPQATGEAVELRAGYRVPSGFSVEIAVGFLAVRDSPPVRGPYAAVGASVRRPLLTALAFDGRLDAGLAYINASDIMPLVRPELGVDIPYGRFRFGAAVGLWFALNIGPAPSHNDERAQGAFELFAPRLFVRVVL